MVIQSCCASSRRKKCAERSPIATSKLSLSGVNTLHLLDFSNQNLGALPEFVSENCDAIEHLILDGNQLTEHALEDVPRLTNLKTLSLNSNKVKNVGVCLQLLQRKCPNLRFLSLIGNPGWPHPIKNPDLNLYLSYARAAAKFLPSLLFLDTTSLHGGRPTHHQRAVSGCSAAGEERVLPLAKDAAFALTRHCNVV